MLSKDLGGIQQSFVKYSQMLGELGFEVQNIIAKNAEIALHLDGYKTVGNLFQWDVFSIWKLRLILKQFKPDAIICHGSRAIIFAHYANQDKKCRLIGAAHNKNYKWLFKCDAIIAVTKSLANFLISKNLPKERLHIVGNAVEVSKQHCVKEFKKPVVIGALSRFVKIKGIDIFLKAIAILQNKGLDCRVVIGGDGDEKNQLMELSSSLRLKNVDFIGWVIDKDSFFQQIDIFCLPSIYESFGIVLLEAMLYSTPIVATKSEGPLENIIDCETGVLCEVSDPGDLADKLLLVAQDSQLAQKIATDAYNYLLDNFSQSVIGKKLNKCIHEICST